jgi:hypothetical protein
MTAPRSFQDIILRLQAYWAAQGCAILQPYDMEVGAGTFHPATTLRALGPAPSSCREARRTAGVDSRGWTPRWDPLGRGGLRQGPAESTPGRGQVLVLSTVFTWAAGLRGRVASHKIATDASEVAR